MDPVTYYKSCIFPGGKTLFSCRPFYVVADTMPTGPGHSDKRLAAGGTGRLPRALGAVSLRRLRQEELSRQIAPLLFGEIGAQVFRGQTAVLRPHVAKTRALI